MPIRETIETNVNRCYETRQIYQIGDRVQFDWDGFKGTGEIILVRTTGICTVLLDDQSHGGWRGRSEPGLDQQYYNSRCWNVGQAGMTPCITELGNKLD